ncbi:MAG: lactoylglutathione lyase [Flavobacteriales bacterium]|nr:MAG: lactoylglutathione lyase [Flavobacteriales bacterium]
MDKTTNTINWFEIPALDIERSKKFYETVFNIKMETTEMLGCEMAFFPFEPGSGKLSGAIIKGEQHKPSTEGSFVYLNANPSMDESLSKVEAAGGKILNPKTSLGDCHGFCAYIMDTEGNCVGIHSNE